MKEIIFRGLEKIEDAYKVREKVFIKEQGVEEKIEKDDFDKEATHVIIYDKEIPIATARLIEKSGIYSIGRVAVLKEYRGKLYGKRLIKILLEYAKKRGIKEIELHAQINVENFYKNLGFESIGEVYIEAEIEHITMIKKV